MKQYLFFILFLMYGFLVSAQTLQINSNTFKPGASISVNFTAPLSYDDNAWVGIIPSNIQHGSEAINDQHDITYQYIKRRSSGTMQFAAPAKEGRYDFRMHDTDTNGNEVASVSFVVSNTSAGKDIYTKNGNITSKITAVEGLSIGFKEARPGEIIRVNFNAPSTFADNAWIGIIPSNIPHGSEAENDKYDVSYQYLKKRTTGTLEFKAPAKEGNYDFRLYDTDNNGKEISYVSFTITNSPGENNNISKSGIYIEVGLSANVNVVRPGEAIQVNFKTPSTYPDNAWIGIIPSNVSHGSEAENDKYDLSYQYLKKRTSGTLTFTAPAKEGKYDFRMHDTDSNGKEVAYVSFTVKN